MHRDLVTEAQIVDMIACLLFWSSRSSSMSEPHRPELLRYCDAISTTCNRALGEVCCKSEFETWGHAHLVFID